MKMRLPMLTVEEKQILVGPTVVGCLLGAFAAYAVFAFASEYQFQSTAPASDWATAGEAAVAFVVCVAGTVGVLGCVPIAIGRFRSHRNSDA